MLDEKGAVEKSFTADAAVEAKETQTVTLSWPWADPRLWDVGQPNLYTLRLKVKGAGLDDEYDQEFGFREFWIEGRQVLPERHRDPPAAALLLLRAARAGGGQLLGDGALRRWMPAAMPPTRGGTSTTRIARDTWWPSMSSTPTST